MLQNSFMVTEEDMALVHGLQLLPRSPWSSLAPVLDTSPETLERRWSRLHDSGLVWISALLNSSFTKDGCLAYVGASCKPTATERVARSLAKEPEVLSVEVTTGKYDLLLTVATTSLETMTRCLLERIDKIPGLTHTHAMLATTLFKNGTQWRLESLSRRQITSLTVEPQRLPSEEYFHLSPVDHKLWDALRKDGRMTFVDLGLISGISRNTAQRHVERMLRGGVFSIRCDVAARAFGWPVSVSLGIDINPAQLGEIGRGLASLQPVRLVVALADRPNILVTSWLRTLEDVPRFETKLIEMFPGIRIMDRFVNLYSTKRMGRLLSTDGRAIVR
jgi:DNA-binding Lrp family transcriptional regulator